MRLYKILYETFSHLMLEKFENEHPNTVKASHDSIGPELINDYNDVITSQKMEDHSNQLVSFKNVWPAKEILPSFGYPFFRCVSYSLT